MTEKEYKQHFQELEARCFAEKTSLSRAMALASFLAIEYMRNKKTTLEEGEKAIIDAAIIRNNGNKSAAARDLGIDRRTLHRRLACRVPS